MAKKSLIFIFDIKNTQRDYALCLEFIKTIERRLSYGDEGLLINICKQINVFSGFVNKTSSPKYFEQPIQKYIQDKVIENDTQIEEKHKFVLSDLEFVKNGSLDLRYHLRIKLDSDLYKSDYINLQYLALLMKRVDSLGFFERSTQNKLTAFIRPCSGDVYPFYDSYNDFDQDTYKLVSQYLRLLSKKYNGVIFGALLEKDEINITALDFKKADKFDAYFPIIPVNKEVYTKLFENLIEESFFKELFLLQKKGRFRRAADKNPEEALVDFIAETSYKRLLQRSNQSNMHYIKEKIQDILLITLEKENLNLMEFSIFFFLLDIRDAHNEAQIQKIAYNTLSLSREICYGLKQVAQNAIQHSEGKECVISFFLHDLHNYNSQKLERNSLLVKDINDASRYGEVLQINVSDLNELCDMCESFVKNLSYEVKKSKAKYGIALEGHELLISNYKDIRIGQFFSEYSNMNESSMIKKAWSRFRAHDIVGHVGLSLFAITAEKCDAVVKVISSKQSVIDKEKSTFVKNYYSPKPNDVDLDYVIPGTQFEILIPVNEWNKKIYTGLGKLNYKNYAKEDYVTFAKFVEYEVYDAIDNYVVYPPSNRVSSATDAKQKYEEMLNWLDFWENRFNRDISVIKNERSINDITKQIERKKVFVHDFINECEDRYYKNENTMEVCLKGLVACLDLIKDVECNMYIAILNTPSGTIETLKRILVLLGIREFPGNLQLFVCEKENHENNMVLLGNDISHIVYNSYLLSLEHGSNGFSKNDCVKVQELKNKLTIDDNILNAQETNELGAFPFDVILKVSQDNDKTLFEEKIERIAEGEIDKQSMGYKLKNTHMRLGSKLHINSFYEMSFLFYRTTVANRIAFLILRKLILENNEQGTELLKKDIDIMKDNIIFYGYASYSKAILTSITEITKEYRKKYSGSECESEKYTEKIGFASYQHNLQSESEKIQMYYYLPNGFDGSVGEDNNLNLSQNAKIIQIVPISTTLTTFDKMWSMLCESSVNKQLLKLYKNYTIFWVKDKNTIKEEYNEADTTNIKLNKQSGIANKYISLVKKDRGIVTRFEELHKAGNGEVCYFMSASVKWHDPLRCKLCYPDNVMDELPLIETDATSTVPSQQIRYVEEKNKDYNDKKSLKDERNNSERIKNLHNCVSYGHIYRRQNHYQFYIDTQKYFYNVKDDVKRWLTQIKEDNAKEEYPILNIIFSPEHNTNVGFAQYVNTFYFDGLAEVVSFNVDKQFRSNFICEHTALIEIVNKLHEDERDTQVVRFYFVDDTIISGETFEKANSFLQSLIPDKEREKYSSNLFSKVFLLVDRLSNATKSMYVRDVKRNFISYVHIDVSNIRTQGDSCIGCKLEQDAEKMFKRSPTKKLASHWAQKLTKYKKISYDNRTDMKDLYNEKSYYKLVMSHVLQNLVVNNGKSYDLGDAYDCLLDISLWMLSEGKDNIVFSELLENIRGIEGLKIILKTICRPFFLYDFKIRQQVLTLYVMLSELLMGTDEQSENALENKPFFNYGCRKERTKELAKKISNKIKGDELFFIQNYLFEGLVDMGSTYPMRKQTINKSYKYIIDNKCQADKVVKFWDDYAINVYRLVANNADETKELWLECLYLSGKEYEEVADCNEFEPNSLYEEILSMNNETNNGLDNGSDKELYKKLFFSFCNELFLQNTGINFDALERLNNNKIYNDVKDENSRNSFDDSKDEKLYDSKSDSEIKNYFYEYWKHMISLSKFKIYKYDEDEKEQKENQLLQDKFKREDQIELFEIISNKNDDGDANQEKKKSVGEWYEKFLNSIKGMILEKYKVEKECINIALITGKKDDVDIMQSMDFVKEAISFAEKTIEEEKFEIKNRIINALFNDQDVAYDLENSGYYISDNNVKTSYIIMFFDNPDVKSDVTKTSLMKFERVFLYVGFKELYRIKDNYNYVLKFILRDILTYRNRIIRRLEKDFYGDIFSKYAHTIGEKNILSHEKAKSHSTTADDEATIEMLVRPDVIETEYKVFGRGDEHREIWLLLRNYTNGQIAKLFNRIFSEEGENKVSDIMPLYLRNDLKKTSSEELIEIIDKEKYKSIFLFNSRLKFFTDLDLQRDGRFELLNKIIEFDIANLNDAVFIQSESGEFYNLEYFKCILIDICLSAIKYSSDREKYLFRVDRFLQLKKLISQTVELNDEEIQEYKKQQCRIWIFREEGDCEVDYLVIRNSVDKYSRYLNKWKDENEKIEKRLNDPLDFIDGHMSLLTIKKYIERLIPSNIKCRFEYIEVDSENNNEKEKNLFFETKLPVLKKERRQV